MFGVRGRARWSTTNLSRATMVDRRIVFEPRNTTSFHYLTNVQKLNGCLCMTSDRFGKFVRDLLNDLKHSKCAYYNSIIGQLITVYQESLRPVNEEQTQLLAQALVSDNIVVTDIKANVYLKKLKTNSFTDNIDYLILPSFTLWDHGFLVFLNKKFNSKNDGGLVNIWGAAQKVPVSQGIIKDLIQNKNGYAGQYLYSTFLNTASFYANVQCFNGLNELIPPRASVQRYYGRSFPHHVQLKVWNTRHPNISQLSTQYSRVRLPSVENSNWNVKVGLGTFVGANRDCDGDKEVLTYLPYPNSLIDLESLLYCDPTHSFLCYDKPRLAFVSQQIYYLYKNFARVEALISDYPLIHRVWRLHAQRRFNDRLERTLCDTALLISSNCATLLFQQLAQVIDDEEMVCDEHELESLSGCFEDMVLCGAKGSANLLKSTASYRNTRFDDVNTVAQRAISGLNSHITSHGRVKFSGGDVYHNSVIFSNLYIKNYNVCYKQESCKIGELANIPSQFLFPEHLLDIFIQGM
uniref:Late expression factor 9 n=1 Tax=Achaea janata granulovirus TaxID=262174 RepID=L7UV15_9BBAC|nr:late expression factor 9 [Achaea janata granulovirus]